MAKKKSKLPDNNIAYNRSAKHEFFIESNLEVGIALEGWEVKSLREKNLQLKESYVFIKNSELWLSGANITPLSTASTHIKAEPTRVRKLLAHRIEIDRLLGMVERKGYTLIAVSAYWKHGRAKLDIGLGRGKKLHDKRDTEKNRDWARDKSRILKNSR
ncbi:MAG: SsrA-binding protein SmpB [Gammaproteobacteria bacterium]|nr:SsrA-binding protein SmpB [Gammaproteobacteria bacterium]